MHSNFKYFFYICIYFFRKKTTELYEHVANDILKICCFNVKLKEVEVGRCNVNQIDVLKLVLKLKRVLYRKSTDKWEDSTISVTSGMYQVLISVNRQHLRIWAIYNPDHLPTGLKIPTVDSKFCSTRNKLSKILKLCQRRIF